MKLWIFFFMIEILLTFSSTESLSKSMDSENDVFKLSSINYELNFDKLPLKGQSLIRVWGGYHWPFKDGGTAKILSDQFYSPLEKLEKISDWSIGAQEWELQSVINNQNYSWGGHCNGLAVAGIVEPEPLYDVTIDGITFTPDEIKALLIEIYQGPMPVVGSRCNFKKSSPEYYRHKECLDLNPATFHLALANHLGFYGEPIIIDVIPSTVVFNYPVINYESKFILATSKEVINLEKHNRIDPSQIDNLAKSLYLVDTRIQTTAKIIKYTYLLEIDHSGNVSGGIWVGESVDNHPDFVWLPNGYSLENPFIDIASIKYISNLSYKLKK